MITKVLIFFILICVHTKQPYVTKHVHGTADLHSLVRSFVHFLYRFGNALQPIPADFWHKAGYTLDKSPVHRRA